MCPPISPRSNPCAPKKVALRLYQIARFRVPCGIVSYQASDALSAGIGLPKDTPALPTVLASPANDRRALAKLLARGSRPSGNPRGKASARSSSKAEADDTSPARQILRRAISSGAS